MHKFFEDCSRSIEDINSSYAGKSMEEIMKIEQTRKDILRDEVDSKHTEFIKPSRTRMLTVQKLIDYLKTQDPDACILAYEPNSFAYIEQWPDLPNPDICTVAEDKKRMEEDLKHWYRDSKDAETKVKRDIDEAFRYARDNDIIIKFQ